MSSETQDHTDTGSERLFVPDTSNIEGVSQSQVNDEDTAEPSKVIEPAIPKPTTQKKRHIEEEDDDLSTLTMQTTRKRVAGKLIDKLWEPLDGNSLISLDRILNISLSKAIERYEGNKMAAAQRILAHSWSGDSPKSFKSRLKVTKVPLTSTIGKTEDPLSLDSVQRRKTFLETYLSADLKQLDELQRHYRETESVYKSDLEYLDELKKTTSAHLTKMGKEIKPIDLPPQKDSIKLAKVPELKYFDPDTDNDTRELLETLSKHLRSIRTSTEELATFNDRLEVVYNMLDIL